MNVVKNTKVVAIQLTTTARDGMIEVEPHLLRRYSIFLTEHQKPAYGGRLAPHPPFETG